MPKVVSRVLSPGAVTLAMVLAAGCAHEPAVKPDHYTLDRYGNRLACYPREGVAAREFDCVPDPRYYAYGLGPRFYDPFWDPFWHSPVVVVRDAQPTRLPPPSTPCALPHRRRC